MSRWKSYIGALAAMLLLGALMTPSANADHAGADKVDNDDVGEEHEPIPNIPMPNFVKSVCEVSGTVVIDQGVEPPTNPQPNKNHNHYTFEDVLIICESNNLHYTGIFAVTAERNGTDGCAEVSPLTEPEDPKFNPCDPKDEQKKPKGVLNHGEDTSQGWSHSDGYDCLDAQDDSHNTNKGDIAVDKLLDPQASINVCGDFRTESWVKFVRGWVQNPALGNQRTDGASIIAWGHLAWNDPENKKEGQGDCFRADLSIEPLPPEDKDGDPATVDPIVTGGVLEGTAVIYNIFQYTDTKTDTKPDGTDDNDLCDFQIKHTTTSSSSPGNGNGPGSRGSQ